VIESDDIGKCILDAEAMAELGPLQKKAPASWAPRVEFGRLPYKRTLAAAGQLKDTILAVLIELDHRRFKTHQNPVPLTNVALRSVGITHWAKNRALR
jgi:hypothetical protein